MIWIGDKQIRKLRRGVSEDGTGLGDWLRENIIISKFLAEGRHGGV